MSYYRSIKFYKYNTRKTPIL